MKAAPNYSGFRSVLILFVLVHTGAIASLALSPDSRLLSLVPPESRIVSGTRATSSDHPKHGFLLILPANRVDLDDFMSLTGADASRVLEQVIFTAAPGADADSPEHTLLVRGHFDARHIFNTAGGDAMTVQYHGVRTVLVPPFARERNFFKHERLLAIIDSSLAIFGTVPTVQRELDRFLAGAKPDAAVIQRLRLLHDDDQSWSLVLSADYGVRLHELLGDLDPALENLPPGCEGFQLGIRQRKNIEIEYGFDLGPAAPHSDDHPRGFLRTSMAFSSAFVGAEAENTGPSGAAPAKDRVKTVSIPRPRYEKWLASLPSRALSR